MSAEQRTKDERVLRTAAGGWTYSDRIYHRRLLRRLYKNIVKDANGCWLWQGTIHPRGYGQTNYRGKTMNVHRAMYIAIHNVKLSTDQLVCHKCDVRHCIRPKHLWLGDPLTNQQDKNEKGRNYFTNQTHCWRGHEFTPENTHIRKPYGKKGPSRVCKTCARIEGRLKAGWTLEQAMSLPPTPHGHRPVAGRKSA